LSRIGEYPEMVHLDHARLHEKRWERGTLFDENKVHSMRREHA
jgi:hypothetical protein